ncbi:hypothetical protein [Actinomadura oligospora]|uniref:hypothetical protein n=1 Tax=Actinomadura oligospora TaxID=111804 RepID=UPI00047A9359|nr:hypothetical protein [Actinomadura oligospora]
MLARTVVWDGEVAEACASGACGWPGALTARQYLGVLAGCLRERQLSVEASDAIVLVADPDRPQAEVRVVCCERPGDGDRLWFWDASGTPLASAECAHYAVGEIRRLLARSAGAVAS